MYPFAGGVLLLRRIAAIERVTSFLGSLSKRCVACNHDADRIHVPMTRYDSADHLGLATETVCRTMSGLKASGVVAFSRNSDVRLVDIDR